MPEKIGYCRVSTQGQDLSMQKEALKKAGCRTIFSDIASGSRSKRPGLEKCLSYLEKDDILMVWKSDRLGRSTVELLKIIESFEKKGIHFKSLTEELLDSTTPNGRLMLGIVAVLAQHERDRLKERTRAGLAAARARGRMGGRPTVLNDEKKVFIKKALQDRDNSIKSIARAVGVGTTTVYRYQQELKKQGLISWIKQTQN